MTGVKWLSTKTNRKRWRRHWARLRNEFGERIHHAPGEDRSMDVETISTGSLSLDIALGAGGLPMGRIVRKSTDRNLPEKPR